MRLHSREHLLSVISVEDPDDFLPDPDPNPDQTFEKGRIRVSISIKSEKCIKYSYIVCVYYTIFIWFTHNIYFVLIVCPFCFLKHCVCKRTFLKMVIFSKNQCRISNIDENISPISECPTTFLSFSLIS
jgi:hypothetical protein